MPTTKRKPNRTRNPAPPASERATDGEVLTLAEAAAYLRVPEEEVPRLVSQEGVPGRRIGSEWRFLRVALQNWLAMPSPPTRKEMLLAMSGKYKDDPFVVDLLREADRKHGRSIAGRAPFTLIETDRSCIIEEVNT